MCLSLAASQPVIITQQPIGGRILVGRNITLMCSASGSGTLTFFWERSINGSSWTTVSNANTTSYTTDTTLAIGQYVYRCRVSNEDESVVSTNATVDMYGKDCYNMHINIYVFIYSCMFAYYTLLNKSSVKIWNKYFYIIVT